MGNAIEVGQVVRLRSGGPDMTVQDVDGESARCRWFEQTSGGGVFKIEPTKHTLNEASFAVASLRVVAAEVTAAVPPQQDSTSQDITSLAWSAARDAVLYGRYRASFWSQPSLVTAIMSAGTRDVAESKAASPKVGGPRADKVIVDDRALRQAEAGRILRAQDDMHLSGALGSNSPVPDPFDPDRYRETSPEEPPADRSNRGYEFLGRL